MILALAGGVGGAKLANGLAQLLAPADLVVAVNTGDDFRHLGLHISPDLDTVMYTLAGCSNPQTGWGHRDETWNFLDALGKLGGATWFRLGDRDLATHVERTRRLAAGESLGAATAALCSALGIRHRIVPMSNDPVRTLLHTDAGVLEFQDYFVHRRCEPVIRAIEYAGAEQAKPSEGLIDALASPQLEAIVLCPSNPYLSIAPLLAIPGLRQRLSASGVPILAVSPIIAGMAVKGPAAKIMAELGHTPSVATVARFYAGLIDGLVIDESDRDQSAALQALGLKVCITDALMPDAAGQARLARTTLEFAAQCRSGPLAGQGR